MGVKKRKAAEVEEPEEVTETVPEEGKKKKKKQKQAAEEEEVESSGTAEEFRKKFHIVAVPREGQTEASALPEPVQSFSEAPFGKKIREALEGAGFAAPSPIQAQAWPIAVTGSDLVAVAKTGSGKTLAFLCPAFKMIARHLKAQKEAGEEKKSKKAAARPLALVLAPTRELATQIEVECAKFAGCVKVRSAAIFGGAPKGDQLKVVKSKDPQILVATPGRLQDFMSSGEVLLEDVQLLVLDEADRMLDMGFEPEIKKILESVPEDRQTLLFTATWPKAVRRIATSYLKEDYFHVNVGQTEELSANKAVSQQFHKLGDDEKDDKLWKILSELPDDAKMICFANTKRRIEGFYKTFTGKGYDCVALHGDKPQWERDRDLANFAKGDCWLMFATDVCARGLDIKAVSHVVNLDMARDVESYVHRIGRTGRAGATGISITFWNEAYDTECAPALVKIAQEAGQEVPEWLQKAAAKQKQVKNKGWRY
eukprot:CAMPEP_0197652788 /NCGR_PEP_ID=MMETSP1338-20131121/34659_1 /TAXON_ID=43686 ORGANISM="Pelagodinium beii, Strain RCC1491" /NCGR_SAMPLE_ID=MMETSP1338 /ASSEMBLY_ACC=CAM_ASM_000754 /LENGTH=482 /DNA_ID=CAMNT_0043227731 /DNA_START=47 /DNA_END=1495 /DNA_ORIENTATION=+